MVVKEIKSKLYLIVRVILFLHGCMKMIYILCSCKQLDSVYLLESVSQFT